MEFRAEKRISDLLDLCTTSLCASEDALPLGIDSDSHVFSKDLLVIPHALICGVSGSGKTAFLQTLLTVVVNKKSEKEIKLLIYDSKLSDYSSFNGIPHVYIPTINDPTRGTGCIQWVLVEMLKRYRLFSEAKVKNISMYNEICEESLPHVFVIIDDFFELIHLSPAEGDLISSLQRILISGRQAGIHCMLVTAVPSDKRLKKELLPNIPCKICFAFSSVAESKAILEMPNAAKLNSPGEIIYKDINTLRKVQVFYASDEELAISLSKLKSNQIEPTKNDNQVSPKILEFEKRHVYGGYQNASPSPEQDCKQEGLDEMLPAAVNVVLETGSCSVSMLQRRVKLGYSRAARIVDQLEEIGVVGPYEGAKPRAVLVNREQWKEIANNLKINLNVDFCSGIDIE